MVKNMLVNKKLGVVVLVCFLCGSRDLSAQSILDTIDQINMSVIKELKKKKPLEGRESIDLNAYPIYWVNYKHKGLTHEAVDSTGDLSDLSLCLEKRKKRSNKTYKDIVTFGLLYNKKGDIIGEVNEIGITYAPTPFSRWILPYVVSGRVKYVFFIQNAFVANVGNPFLLIAPDGRKHIIYEFGKFDENL